MDETSQQRLAEITAKEPAALTPGDILFLRARVSYLTADQLALYGGVLTDEPTQDEKAAKPAKPSKE